MKKPAKKSVSGPNIPEEQRKTVPIKLRLAPDVAAHLKSVAAEQDITMSVLVKNLLLDDEVGGRPTVREIYVDTPALIKKKLMQLNEIEGATE